MGKDLVSVIVPVYNIEKYIKNCIESILRQTYMQIEVILVDDGSTDTSGKICDEYAEKDDRIRVIHKENEGVSSARNSGLLASEGEYISFVDGDDLLAINAVEVLMNDITEDNSLVYSGTSYRRINNYHETFTSNLGSKTKYTRDYIIKGLLSGSYENIGVWGKVFRKEFIGNLLFEGGRGANEDKYFLFQLLMNHDGYISEREDALYGYYIRDGSATTSKYSVRLLDVLFFSNKILERIQNEKEAYLEIAQYNDMVAHLSILKAIVRSGMYHQEKDTFQRIKKQMVTRYGQKEKNFFGGYKREYRVLQWNDLLYRVCVRGYDCIKMRKR